MLDSLSFSSLYLLLLSSSTLSFKMVKLHSFGALAAVSTLLPAVSVASPVASSLLRLAERQSDFFAITGVTEGGQQPRLNLRELQRNPEHKDLWAIYILALQSLQAVDQKDKLSWYQVAGKTFYFTIQKQD